MSIPCQALTTRAAKTALTLRRKVKESPLAQSWTKEEIEEGLFFESLYNGKPWKAPKGKRAAQGAEKGQKGAAPAKKMKRK